MTDRRDLAASFVTNHPESHQSQPGAAQLSGSESPAAPALGQHVSNANMTHSDSIWADQWAPGAAQQVRRRPAGHGPNGPATLSGSSESWAGLATRAETRARPPRSIVGLPRRSDRLRPQRGEKGTGGSENRTRLPITHS